MAGTASQIKTLILRLNTLRSRLIVLLGARVWRQTFRELSALLLDVDAHARRPLRTIAEASFDARRLKRERPTHEIRCKYSTSSNHAGDRSFLTLELAAWSSTQVFGAGTRRVRLTIVKRGKFGAQRAGARHAGAQHTGDRRGGTQCAGDRRASDRHSAYVWALDEALSRYGGSSRRTAFFARDSNVAPCNLFRKNSARSTGFVSHNTKRMSSYEEPTRRILFGRILEILPTPRTVIDAHNRCMAWCAAFDARGNRLVGLDVSECSTSCSM
jgi:hypothetical protein